MKEEKIVVDFVARGLYSAAEIVIIHREEIEGLAASEKVQHDYEELPGMAHSD